MRRRQFPGRPLPLAIELYSAIGEEVEELPIPDRWTREVGPYVALLDPDEAGQLWRVFVSRVERSKSGKTGELVLETPLDVFPVGTLLEVKRKSRRRNFRGGRRQRMQEIYRRDPYGWRIVAQRYIDRPITGASYALDWMIIGGFFNRG